MPKYIAHPPQHDYRPVSGLLDLELLSEHRIGFSVHFTHKLIEGQINAPRLLEPIYNRIPDNARLQELFHLSSVSRSNFAKNVPIITMMLLITF